MRSSKTFVALSLVMMLLFSGCVTSTQDGSARLHHYEWWVSLFWVVAGVAAGPLGWICRGSRYGWALLLGCPVMLFGVAPTTWFTGVRVDDDGFSVRNGIWGATSNCEVKFADVKAVRLTSETSRTRRGGKRTNYYLNFDQSAKSEKVSIGNDVLEAGSVDIIMRLAKRGIEVVDQAQPQ